MKVFTKFYGRVLTFLLFVVSATVYGQTTLISPTGDGGFENGSTFAANGWTVVNHTTNTWQLGAASTAFAGTNAAYVSNDGGTTWAYTHTVQTSHFYRDITVPAGETKINLNFQWKGNGESGWDRLLVYAAPTSVTPVAGTPASNTTTLTGATLVYTQANASQATYTAASVFLPTNLSGTTFRLIFTWQNDGGGGTSPGASVDNISLTSAVPGTFTSAATGNWTAGATWVGGVAPSSVDNAVIAAGHTVTIDASSLSITDLEVGGTLAYGSTPSSFAVLGNLTVNSGGTFNVFQSTTGKTLNVAGNITNNGSMNISVGSTTAGNLTLNGTTVQTVSGSGTWTSDVIRNLTFNNTNTSTPNIFWSVNNIKVAYNLTFTNGRVALGTNKMIFGNSAAPNSLTVTSGGFLSGTFSRWWATNAQGTAITSFGSDITTTTSRYPFITSTGLSRAITIYRTTTGNTAGELAVTYSDASTYTTGLSVTDGAYTVTDRTNASWTISTAAGYVYTSGTHTISINGQSMFFTSTNSTRIMRENTVVGTHQNASTTPSGFRNGLNTAQLTGGAFYLGLNSADAQFVSIASGNFNDAATWNKGTVPTCTDIANIASGHNVTVNSAGNQCRNLNIAVGGTLTMASGNLTVGCTLNNNTFVNNGTLTVSGGTLNVNGSMVHNSGSTFNQSSGNINVDGNAAGVIANSATSHIVDLATTNLNLTGGILTIIDPSASTSTSVYALRGNVNTATNIGTGHTIRFGDGVSTDAGGSTNGFYSYLFQGSSYVQLGNVEVNGSPSGANRHVTPTSNYGILGNLTVNNANGEFRVASTVYVNGNVTVNTGATLTTTSTLALANYFNATVAASTNAQTIGGSGTFRNSTTTSTASIASLTVNNSNATGVTLNVPLSISSTLTLTSGLVNTTATNLLQLGTATAAGTLSGTPSATNMIVGPFARTFAASRTASGTYTVAGSTHFPVGKGSTSMPIFVDPSTSAGGSVIITSEAFTSNSGTSGAGVSNLSSKTWSALATTGAANMTNAFVRVQDASVTATSKLLHAGTAAGEYNGIPGGSVAVAGSTVTGNTAIAVADYLGNFAYGDLVACTAPADAATDFTTTSLTTTTFNGRFTAAASNPTGYLVVRTATGVAPTTPVDGTLYAAGAALGGTVVGTYYTAPFLISVTGLTASTGYDFHVFSFNNTGCAGPTYNGSALVSTITTCASSINAPTVPTTTNITSSGFRANWTASTTTNVEYVLDVATNNTYTNFVSGYEARNIGTDVSYEVSGLDPTTTYYWRVRSFLTGCYSANATSQTVSTVAVPAITAISPNACNGPATLTITGTGLTGATAVTVGGTPVTAVLTNTATSITATVASGTSGTVSVTNPGGVATSAGSYAVGSLGGVTVTPSVASLCGIGGTSTLTASSSHGGYTYAWTSLTASANLSAATGTSTTATLTETSDIQLTASDAGLGCSEIVVTSIGVYPFPSSTMTVTPLDTVCMGTPITINSGLVAGNFAYDTARFAPRTVPSDAGTLCNAGTAVTALSGGSMDDGGWGGIPIGFTYNYFGTNYTTIAVGTNGTLMFGTVPGYTTTAGHLGQYNFTTTPVAFPNTGNPGNVIAMVAQDNHPGNGGSIRYWTEGYAPNRRFVVAYINVPEYSGGGTTTSQVILYETTGLVEMHCTNASTGSSRAKIVGLQNSDKTIGATAVNGSTANITNKAWRFTPPSNYTTTWTGANITSTTSGTNIFTANATPATAGNQTYSIVYTNSVTGCSNSTSPTTKTVVVQGTPTTSVAGDPQSIASTSFTLNGNAPSVGTGAWRIVSGDISITDTLVRNTAVTMLPGTATLRWVISNGYCTPSTSDVTLTSTVPLGVVNTTTSCQSFTSVTIDATNNNRWVPLLDGSNIVAAIKANGQNLGIVSGGYFRNQGTPRNSAGVFYMDRNVSISTQNAPVSNVDVRFYLTTAEWQALQTAVPAVTDGNFSLNRITGACNAAFPGGVGVVINGATIANINDYRVISFATNEFSDFYVVDKNAILPIELKSFSAAAQGAANRVSWVTATEQNVSHFVVERSEDGRSNWTAIAQTKAVGNSQIDQKYQILDNNPTNLAYYRLRSVDNNGKTQLSNVVSVVRQTSKLTLVTAAPVPFADNLMIDFAANRNANVTITILDLMGRVVHTEQIDALEGMNRANLNLSKLANGAYILNINDGEYKDNRRIIKQQ